MPANRWTRTLQFTLLALTVLLLTIWATPSKPHNFQEISEFIHKQTGSKSNSQKPGILVHESPLLTPSETAQELEVGNLTTTPQHLNKGNPSFHLIITGAKRSARLCRSLLSAAVLDYPPPTLINYDDGPESSSSRVNDAKKVHDFLQSDASSLADHDVVLVVEGESTIFQLPSSVLLHRLQTTEAFANGKGEGNNDITHHSDERVAQSVFLGASDHCSLPEKHEACASLPDSDAKPFARKASSAKFVDGGIAVGLAPDMKRLYMATSGNVGKNGIKNNRAIMTKLFAEQELSRRSKKSRQTGFRSGWKAFVDHKPWGSNDVSSGSEAPLPRDREFGMALDYHSNMFFSASQQTPNMSYTKMTNNHSAHSGAALPADILTSPAPVRPVAITYVDESHNSTALPVNKTIDRLDGQLNWQDLSLALDPITDSIPAVIHFKHPEDRAHGSWAMWKKMWYHPFARALMRNHLRSAEGPAAVQAAGTGGDRELDVRGGKGGFWTESGVWLEFGEVCRGFEDELFADGYGEWGFEGGGHPRCDINNHLYSGEGDCEKIKDEQEQRERERKEEEEARRIEYGEVDGIGTRRQ